MNGAQKYGSGCSFRSARRASVNAFNLSEEHPAYAQSLNNLAHLYVSMREYAKAEPLFRQALEIRKKALGEGHPGYATSLNNLAWLYQSLGEYSKAAPLHRQAREICRRALGEEHPDYARSLHNLALLHESMGACAKAEPLLRKALGIYRRVLDATFAVQSERQQFQMSRLFRATLDHYLTLSARADVGTAEAYAPVLTWKGAIFARQARARFLAEDPKIADLFAEFERTSRLLATLCLATPRPGQQQARRQRIADLTETREELERELSRKSEAYCEVRAAERLSPAELQEALPSGVVLLDFLEYERRTFEDGRPRSQPGRCLLAFVVPATGDIRRLDLGPAAPIAEAIDSWRASLRGRGRVAAGRKLRKLLWEPLAEHLPGVRTLLVSPDGTLTRLPLAALPGEKPGTYLIEEISVAVVPVPQLLSRLLARGSAPREKGSLLLVGDVDYDGSPGISIRPAASRSAAGTRTGALPEFPRLHATRAEVAAIRDWFKLRFEDGTVELLQGDGATEAVFRARASACRWVHIATHGFFAPQRLRSALSGGPQGALGDSDRKVAGYHPGLLSGLALSGANTPPGLQGDDGILTALEVASLDLSRVEVAVLSACETGLGEVAGGEGALGLQRAFQVSGASTAVTSLWMVPDVATELLMQRFYRNLWDKGLPKVEALREAQLWLMREGGKPGSALARGVCIEEGKESMDEDGRLPPYFWAAFVLSGDWR
ncbi:MAG: CHAT domain-containing tetratricopeptide repeat protein [Planctomycetota bacterium]|jgi:CHAT domain-containing protein/Tfp pilus assembly protein PilF